MVHFIFLYSTRVQKNIVFLIIRFQEKLVQNLEFLFHSQIQLKQPLPHLSWDFYASNNILITVHTNGSKRSPLAATQNKQEKRLAVLL